MQAKSGPCRGVSVAPFEARPQPRALGPRSPALTNRCPHPTLPRLRGRVGWGIRRVWLAAMWTVSIIRAVSGPDHRRCIEDHFVSAKPVAVIMGSQSDWATMKHAADTLDALGIAYEARIVSAHRTPDRLYAFAKGAKAAGVRVIIAGAGGAAHLPGMTASMT